MFVDKVRCWKVFSFCWSAFMLLLVSLYYVKFLINLELHLIRNLGGESEID